MEESANIEDSELIRSTNSIWNSASTFPLIVALIYFSMNGLSPFVNDNMYLRFANTTPDSSVLSRVTAWLVYLICAGSILRHQKSILRHFFRLKALALLPLLAIASSIWSQLPLFSLHQGVLLLGATLFAVYFATQLSSREQMQLLMICGAITAIATVLFALLLPQFGLDHLGGHDKAWKGIFTAKNVCGQTMLLLLAPAFYYRSVTVLGKISQAAYIALLIGIILMSQAATSWIFLVVLLAAQAAAKLITRFAFKDMTIVVALTAAVVVAISIAAFENSSFLLGLIGKDPTLTGRTEIWRAALISVEKHPFLGYGYLAFWNGLQGESANLLLSIKNYLSQSQNGFLDIWLQLGLIGCLLIASSVVTVGRDLARSMRSRRAGFVHWYAAIIVLTLLFNTVESYFAFPRYLGWLLYLVACYGLNSNAIRDRKAGGLPAPA